MSQARGLLAWDIVSTIGNTLEINGGDWLKGTNLNDFNGRPQTTNLGPTLARAQKFLGRTLEALLRHTKTSDGIRSSAVGYDGECWIPVPPAPPIFLKTDSPQPGAAAYNR
jgi:hypothetical protein